MFQGFQRIKGAIDNRIAEEQARQKTTPPAGTPGAARKPSSRTESPATKPRRPRQKDDGTRGPDPSVFADAFALEDEADEVPKIEALASTEENAEGTAEPKVSQDAGAPGEGSEKMAETTGDLSQKTPEKLPVDVQKKVRRLARLEPQYEELLRSYRIAHARAKSIEPFEKALKENTPLAGIYDPDALVEYLNQLNLKGDMVMDEYKLVSTDRDSYKKKFEEAEKQISAAQEELAALKASSNSVSEISTDKTDVASVDTTTASVKSPVSSVLGIFSPKHKPESTDNKDVVADFFSYEEEVPKLQAEVNEKAADVERLQSKVTTLEKELATSQQSSSGLVADLEKTTKELQESKDQIADAQTTKEKVESQVEEIRVLKGKLESTESELAALEASLAKEKKESGEKISSLEDDLTSHQKTAGKNLKSQIDARKEAEKASEALDAKIKELQEAKVTDTKRIEELSGQIKGLEQQISETAVQASKEVATTTVPNVDVPAEAAGAGASKKKNKKKKKGGAAATALLTPKDDAEDKSTANSVPATPIANDLEAEITRLKEEVTNRDTQIEKLQTKRKNEEELRYNLEIMEESLISNGQDLIVAKEKIKELQGEKKALEEKIASLEKDIEGYKAQASDSKKATIDLEALNTEYEDLKLKSATLRTDLGAASQLATTRYKELTDLRDVLQKAQPELKQLRAESATLKTTKDELNARTADLRRLEAREKDLKSDITSFKKQASDSQIEIRTLTEKVTQETNARIRLEDQTRFAQRDMRKAEAEKIQLSASLEKSSTELTRVQEEVAKLRTKVRELEDQVAKSTAESKTLRDEVELRTSQYSTAQGLLGSMRDQSGELVMQLKEKTEQRESLEEELTEVQRLLSERTREGETMRRLLADVDDRADAKVREMRERMEAAIEERDRAEDEASTTGRRRAREVDELKSKVRDLERDFKRATEEQEELQHDKKEWIRRRDELESVADDASKEASEIRAAMGELRDALDGSEKQAREAEKQRADLRRMLDESNQKYEKLQKEFKILQAKQMAPSSRSSIDSGRSSTPVNGQAGKMDYVYLKTILLQFLEQRDKKRQADLVKTVLGQLLHFDKKDQERWIAAISAK